MTRRDLPPDPAAGALAARRVPTSRARQVWRALLALLLAATAAVAWTPDPPPRLDVGWDKANHLLAFVVLTVVARLAFRRQGALLPAAALFAYGVLIEVVQAFVPGRSAEAADVLADAVGIGCALLLSRALRV